MARQPTLENEEVQQYLTDFHRSFVIVPIDKAANNLLPYASCWHNYVLLAGKTTHTWAEMTLSIEIAIYVNSVS